MPDQLTDPDVSTTFLQSRALLKDGARSRGKAAELPAKHPNEKQALRLRHESRFFQWLLYLQYV